MHFETRLWKFTEGVRGRIAFSALIGLFAAGLGIARLGLLGWLIALIFAGASFDELTVPVLIIGAVIIVRGLFEHWRTMIAHTTAAEVQKHLRRVLFDKVAALGPGFVGRQRSGDVTLSLVDGVEQLESYFGQYLPQLIVSLMTPILIFGFVAWIDLPVAAILLAASLVALFAPAIWHQLDSEKSMARQKAYGAFAAELLDSIQGLATLKAFGQSKPRADLLAEKARDLFKSTMWVLATNSLGRGITDSSIAIGAAAALAVGAFRVADGEMTLAGLLIILMMGVEIFRPMRELRNVLHQGMVGLSAAKGIYQLLEADTPVEDAESVPAETLAPQFSFEDVAFTYPGSRRITHDGLNFEVSQGERIGVVGTSGAGKSSIVRLLLRFYDPDQGRITLGGKDLRSIPFEQIRSMIAVVSQDTYLFHGTIEENIRMGRPEASHEDIEAAARAANIHDFVMTLGDGYQTTIGEKGIKLSGGQRQRVAIARALLRDAPILVLDEALSAVDAENEAIIQDALNHLMQGRTTLVLAHRLSSIIDCDRILVLDEGRVVETGNHSELIKSGGVYSSLMSGQAQETRESEPDLIDDRSAPAQAETIADVPGGAVWQPTEGVIKAEGMNWAEAASALFKLIMPWRGKLALTFLFGVTRVLGFIGVGVLSALALYELKNGGDFTPYLIGLAFAAPLAGILHWFESWIAHDMAFRLLAEMRIDFFRKLDSLAPAYLVRRRTGDLMGVATQDIELVEYFFAHTVAPAFVAVLVPAAVVTILFWHSPWIGLALLPFLLAVAISPMAYRNRVDELGSRAREASGELNAHMVDSVQGLGEIVTYQQEQRRGDEFDRLAEHHIALRVPFFEELTRQQTILEVLTGLGGLAVVATGGWLVANGQIDAGLLPLMTILALSAFLPVSEIAQIGKQLADTLGSTRRVYGVQNEEPTVTDGPGAKSDNADAAFEVRNVRFQYPGTVRNALSAVDFSIPAGSTTALVGMSGAGKTTIAQLLMRFWDPSDGTVILNGDDLRDYKLEDLRARIALVAQDTYLFNSSLRANILIAKPDASEEELTAAVERAALNDLVAMLPEGLDTPVGERGASLSGGQRQRVAIARAFLKDASVLILDEATSHLDAVNEQAVRTALSRLQADRTTIVIAHRLSTIRDADQIIALDQGRVVEVGTHDGLLKKNGLYAQLVSRQLASALAPAAQ